MPNPCVVNDCDKRRYGHGYCNMHYKRWRKTGDPGSPQPFLRTETCSVESCPEPHCALGFCNTHYTRFKATGQVPTTPIRGREPKQQCRRRFCSRQADSKGLCTKHYAKLRLLDSYEPGFTWEMYDQLWDKQRGLCAVCSVELAWEGKSTHVDHCHTRQRIRGILCNMCNAGLGSFRDSPAVVRAAASYLEQTERAFLAEEAAEEHV